MRKGDDKDVSGESVGKELDKVDAKKDPQKVVQLVSSVSSIINYGNQSDTGTREERTKVNTSRLRFIDSTFNGGGVILREGGMGEFDMRRGQCAKYTFCCLTFFKMILKFKCIKYSLKPTLAMGS